MPIASSKPPRIQLTHQSGPVSHRAPNTLVRLSRLVMAMVLTVGVISSDLFAAEPQVQHRLMLFEYGKGPNRLLELDASGKVVWEHKPPSLAVIFHLQPNGNVLDAGRLAA